MKARTGYDGYEMGQAPPQAPQAGTMTPEHMAWLQSVRAGTAPGVRSIRSRCPVASAGGFDLGQALGTIAQVASVAAPQIRAALPQLAAAFSASGVDVPTAPVPTNPVWSDLAGVLSEAARRMRASAPYAVQDQFYEASLVDRLAALAQGLALVPNSPAIEADFRRLGHHLATHPRSQQLAEFITTHPALAPVFTIAHAAGAAPWMDGLYGAGFSLNPLKAMGDLVTAPVHAVADLALAPVHAAADLFGGFGGGPQEPAALAMTTYAQPGSWRAAHPGMGAPPPLPYDPHRAEHHAQMERQEMLRRGLISPYDPHRGEHYAGQAPPPPPPRPAPPGRRGPPPPPRMNSWDRWQRVHPGTSHQDYRNWVSQYGQYGAQIN